MRALMSVSVIAKLVTSVVASALGSQAIAATTYNVTDLGLVNSDRKYVALNNSTRALVMRQYSPAAEDLRIVIENWSDGGRNYSETLIPAFPGTDQSIATAFNDAQDVVGHRSPAFAPTFSRAFVWRNGVFTDLSSIMPISLVQSPHSTASAINNQGDITGSWITRDVQTRAFLYSNGVLTDIGSLGDSVGVIPKTVPVAINSLGQITGLSNTQAEQATSNRNGTPHVFLWDDGAMTNLGRSPTNEVYQVVDMNDRGEIVLTATMGPHYRYCYVYRNGTYVNMGGLGIFSYPTCNVRKINNAGVAVGSFIGGGGPPGQDYGAFHYSEGRMVSLESLLTTHVSGGYEGLHFDDVVDINDKNEIIAITRPSDGIPARYVLLTPTTDEADDAQFNFEAGTQGWERNGEAIHTVSTSPLQKYAGESALSLRFSNEGFASVRVMNPLVNGNRITFHVYLPADANVEWIQPFAQEGATWYGNWKSADGLQRGAWNTLTIDIPADTQSLDAIGLEVFMSTPYASAVYIDSVGFESAPDTANYNFESEAQQWASVGDNIVAVTTSTEHRYSGAKSLAAQFNGGGLASIAVPTTESLGGKTITFHVYLPADANIDWVQPYAQEGEAGNWNWHGSWFSLSELQLGAWNTLTVEVPSDAGALKAIGVEVHTTQASSGTVYIDSVSY